MDLTTLFECVCLALSLAIGLDGTAGQDTESPDDLTKEDVIVSVPSHVSQPDRARVRLVTSARHDVHQVFETSMTDVVACN